MRYEADYVTSTHNPKIKRVRHLWKRQEREAQQRFLIEGYRELTRATSVAIEWLFICPELFLGSHEESLITELAARGAQVYPCSESVFRTISYRDRPDGLLAVAKQFHRTLESLMLSAAPFYVVAEAIEKPGNLGTILRSSDAVGVDALIVCDRCTDIHNPNVVRASVGTLFTVPVIESTGEAARHWLKQSGIQMVAATPSASRLYTEVDLTQAIAVVVGTEQYGLTDSWMHEADIQVAIPMCGVADSLNVATATTVLLYEVLRQRRARALLR